MEGKPSAKHRLFGLGIGSVMIAFLVYNWTHRGQPATEGPKPDPLYVRAIAGAQELRRSMRNPHSFELDQVLAMSNGTICFLYRAQNGYGGLNVATAFVEGESLHREGSAGFIAQWNRSCNGASRLITDAVVAAIRD